MAKRANGEGCVFQDAKRGWSVAITIDGRRVVRKAPVQTRTGADQLLRKLLAERDDGGIIRGSMTLEKYVPEWLEALALRGVRPRSLEAYSDKVRKHLLPALGKVKLDKLTARQVERVYAAKLAEGLSPKSIDLLHTAFNGIMKHAKRRGLIARNPLEVVERPKVPKFEAHPLTIDGAQELLRAVRGHRDGAFWTFLVGTGCRFGEAAGLTWENVDLAEGAVSIKQAAVRIRKNGKTHMELAPTKTTASVRTLPIPPWVIESLQQQRRRVAEMRLAAGPVWNGMDLVFPSERGTPLRQAHVRERWIAMLDAAGLPRCRMHDLRHTFATIMLDGGEDLVAVQRSLGHSKVSITADLYVGRVPNAQRRAVLRYGELLAGSGSV